MDFRAKLSTVSPIRGESRGEGKTHPLAAWGEGQGEGRPLTLARRYPAGSLHGRILLSEAEGVCAGSLALLSLDPRLADVDPSRLLFVDTETTGLHGGAGTLPFLIGLGWFEGGDLHVEQLFLPRPGQEVPLLQRLADRLARASLMVTFNGKCFDWPLLRTRLVMNRLPVPDTPAHLDLLHCARRLFKRRLSTTRLQDLERHVLGFHRLGDIDGALIPAAYFDYLRRGATAVIRQVLEHNVLDVVTMAAVLAELSRRVELTHDDDRAEDCLSLAEVTARAGHLERAEALALLAAERASAEAPCTTESSRSRAEPTGRRAISQGASTLPPPHWRSPPLPREPVKRTALDAWWLAARLAGKRRDWAAVAHRLNTALGLPGLGQEDVQALHLALSRVCEHRLKDRPRALVHARSGAAAEPPAAHARRVARLSRHVEPPQRPFRLE